MPRFTSWASPLDGTGNCLSGVSGRMGNCSYLRRQLQQLAFRAIDVPVLQLISFAPCSAHTKDRDLLVLESFRLAEAIEGFVAEVYR